MEDQLVSHEVARLAKELGFDWRCNNTIDIKTGYESEDVDPELNEDKVIRQPTQTKLQRWLREVHNIHAVVEPNIKEDLSIGFYGWRIRTEPMYISKLGGIGDTYELALDEALLQGMTLINV